jgi:hypothetical protein
VQIEPALARRLARLARRAHAFHRFAHHPLCDRYAGELIALRGRRRICRGCASALGGAVLGATLSASLHLPPLPLLVASSVCLVGSGIALLRRSPLATSRLRSAKLISRAIPAALTTAGMVALLMAAAWAQFALLLAGAALWLQVYRRRGPDRRACQQCPERSGAVPCRGYLPIVQAERAFRRRAHQLLDRGVRASSHQLQSSAAPP